MMTEKDTFFADLKTGTDSLVWVGETHGVTNNFLAYKEIIQDLARLKFATVALEYPEELEQFNEEKFMSYSDYEDGRFSDESMEFFKWLQSTGLRIICFDVRFAVKTQQESEDVMATNLLSKLHAKEKALVVSGSFHGRRKPVKEVIPQAGLVEKAGFSILPVGLKYAGGHFYNFGLKEEDDRFLDFDEQDLPFGTITSNLNPMVDVKYWYHVGKALPVTLISKKTH